MVGVLKDSKVEWIGQVPNAWQEYRLENLVDNHFSGAWGNDEKGNELDRICMRIADFDYQKLQFQVKNVEDYTKRNYTKIEISKKTLKKGDILIEKSGGGEKTPVGRAVVYNLDNNALFANFMDCIRINDLSTPDFVKYYLFCSYCRGVTNLYFNQTTGIQNLNISRYLKESKVFLPDIDMQNDISSFLDEKCAEIDKLSEDIQKQIDILNDYKKSVITRAVTKGLDPNAEMKDSGIEWIGTIPKSWSLIRLKNAAWLKGRIGWQGLRADEFKDDESLPYLITGTDFYNGIVNWDTCVHITEERFNQDRNIQIKEDDLLITKDGTIGKVAIAKKCPQRVSLNSGIFIIRNIGKYKYYSRFMYYVLQSDEFIEWYSVANAGNSTILHLNQEKFYNFVFALPDIESQKYIAERLDVKCAHIDYSISEKYDQLSKLDSYKKSIIYEYVTGKKRVKGVL